MNEIEEMVLVALSGGLTQSQASRNLGIPKSTVCAITKFLLSCCFIKKISDKSYAIKYERIDPSLNNLDCKGYVKVCKNCNQEFLTAFKNQKYCDPLCWGETRQGPNHPLWNGGDQYSPYCYKFNDSLKERVRAFFNHRCVLCRKDERDNLDRKGHPHKLLVHHVNYNKKVCCGKRERQKDRQFVPLCLSCHSKTIKRADRVIWQEYFSRIIKIVYGGKCYFTKEEMRPQDQYYKF